MGFDGSHTPPMNTSRIAILVSFALAASSGFAADKGARSGKEVAETVCAPCHQTGKSGAPKTGDREAWVPRLKRGVDTLALAAIRGHGGMPARGGHAELTDAEVKEAILYMYDPQAQARAAAQPKAAPAKADPNSATVDGLEVRFGLVSAKRLRGYAKGTPEASMHGGVPSGDDQYHVNVTLRDVAKKAAVAGAKVEVDVVQAGAETQTKALEPVKALASYGIYMKLLPRKPATVTVRIRPPGSEKTAQARFTATPE